VPFSVATEKTAFGIGATSGTSDPFLIGPGRIGLNVTTPSIPVPRSASDSPEERVPLIRRSARNSAKFLRNIRQSSLTYSELHQAVFTNQRSPIRTSARNCWLVTMVWPFPLAIFESAFADRIRLATCRRVSCRANWPSRVTAPACCKRCLVLPNRLARPYPCRASSFQNDRACNSL